MADNEISIEYQEWLEQLKAKVGAAQIKAAVKVNVELNLLYWDIGTTILEKQEEHGWGAKIIDRLANDLSSSFPGVKGFSTRNLKYMRSFAAAYPDKQFVQQAVAQIPWGHNTLLINKLGSIGERLWYIQKTLENGWSRAVLQHQLESDLYGRQGKALSNFTKTLPEPQSELARQTLKDPYVFDFLAINEATRERDIETSLITHISKFLLELGHGFAYVGKQHRLKVGGRDFYIDLLFFHVPLNCYVVIELKTTEFDPRDAGQLNFYMAAIDGEIKQSSHNPTIGLLLCKDKDHLVVEYALKNIDSPIGVSQYQLTKSIPASLQGKLPSIEDLEQSVSVSTVFSEFDLKERRCPKS